jgi:hypothetical protein
MHLSHAERFTSMLFWIRRSTGLAYPMEPLHGLAQPLTSLFDNSNDDDDDDMINIGILCFGQHPRGRLMHLLGC